MEHDLASINTTCVLVANLLAGEPAHGNPYPSTSNMHSLDSIVCIKFIYQMLLILGFDSHERSRRSRPGCSASSLLCELLCGWRYARYGPKRCCRDQRLATCLDVNISTYTLFHFFYIS